MRTCMKTGKACQTVVIPFWVRGKSYVVLRTNFGALFTFGAKFRIDPKKASLIMNLLKAIGLVQTLKKQMIL